VKISRMAVQIEILFCGICHSDLHQARNRWRGLCHMVPSVDGRIETGAWRLPPGLLAEYERTGATFGADAWIIGRVSMEPYAGRAALRAAGGDSSSAGGRRGASPCRGR
jgi:hypothetical protein